MKRILLIDSSLEVQTELRRAFAARFDVSLASSCAEARGLLGRDLFDLIILETHLPDGDGFLFCSELRSREMTLDIPVIFLSERSKVSDKIQGFSVGADDYLVKPFDSLELLARVEVRLKRIRLGHEQEQLVQKGDLVLSIAFQKAILKELGSEKDLRLTPTEFRLLYFFIRNEGQVLSRAQLLNTIWSDDVHVLTRTIDKHISTLKKKLDSRAHYIQSIHSRGYSFAVGPSAPIHFAIESSVDSSSSLGESIRGSVDL